MTLKNPIAEKNGKEQTDYLYKIVKIICIPLVVYFLGRTMNQVDKWEDDTEKLKIDMAVVMQISKENQKNLRNLMWFENEKQRREEAQREKDDNDTNKAGP